MSSQRWALIGGGVVGLGALAALLLSSGKPAAPPRASRGAEDEPSQQQEPSPARQAANRDRGSAGPSGATPGAAAGGPVLHRVAFSRGDRGDPMVLNQAPPSAALAQRQGTLPTCPVTHAGAERHHTGACAANIEAEGVQAQIEVNGEMWFDESTKVLHLVEGPAMVRNLSSDQRLIVMDRAGRIFTVQPLSRLDIDAPGPAPPNTPPAVAGDLPPTNNPGQHPPGPIPPGYRPPGGGGEGEELRVTPPPPDYPNPTPGRQLNP